MALMAAKGFASPDVLRTVSKARILSEKLGDENQLFIALCGEASYHVMSGNLREADELGRRCLELASASGDPNLLLEAHHRQWATTFYMGDFDATEGHLDHGLKTYDPDRHHCLTYIYTGHVPGVCCRNHSSTMLWLRGYPDRAIARAKEALGLAERVSHSLSIAQAQCNMGYTHLLRREPDEARRWAEKLRALSTDFHLPLLTYQALSLLGWAIAAQGDLKNGIRHMEEGIAGVTATGAANGLQDSLSILARAYGEDGNAEQGLTVLDRAFDLIAKTGSTYHLSELLRIKGELLLRLNPSDKIAQDWLRRAVLAAREARTKSPELQAALSLARLYRDRGYAKQAGDVLFPVYAWFTEGFETRDLVEAKNLLDQVR